MAAGEKYISVAEARAILGVSKPKMADLLKEGKLLHAEPNPVDKRGKMLRLAEVEALAAMLPKREEAA
jgi:hypothetical protein